MDIYKKIEKLLVDTTVTAGVEQNLAQGSVDVINKDDTHKCKEGYHWCPESNKCVEIGSRRNEEVVSGNVVGSSQTRTVGSTDKEIEVLKTKVPGLVTRFNKLLGGYVVDDTNKQKKD